MEQIADVLVIGGGIAGVTTALALLDSGYRVTLLDRDEQANFGGLAREAFGGMFVVDSAEQRRVGIRDTPELAYQDWCAFAEFGENELWPKRWAQAYVERCTSDVYAWLKDRGVRYFPVPNWVERGQYRPGNSVPRFHMVWGTGQALMDVLIAALERHPQRQRLQLRFGHRVTGLLREAGHICGCHGQTEQDGRAFEFRSDAVVIAAGGINGNLARVREHWHGDWGRAPDMLLNGSHRFADGTLHDAAQAYGAQVTHLDRMWNYAAGVRHFAPRKPDHGLSLVPPRSALWLDWQGRRFGPEPLITGFDTRELIRRICATERPYSWQLLNRRIALKELAVSGAEFNPSIRQKKWLAFLCDILFGNRWLVDTLTQHCPDFVVADTLPELVVRMNTLQGDGSVSRAAVEQAVAGYDAQLDRPPSLMNDEQLRRLDYLRRYRGDRVRTCHRQKIVDPAAGPLIAIRESIISRKSLGGLQTDLQCRVLDDGGQPIGGLYAVGEAAGFGGGGMHGLRALEGTFLGGCVLTARVAAASLAGKPMLSDPSGGPMC
ncbi:FAD-binding dehydrogenase [Chitinivorax sp. PXF-14]|uniref:FAD-binding dehydrogenase n=1 Tax=Chitinivorax sp. PXF-14 TaxID=3230488 RepID=UPI003465937F